MAISLLKPAEFKEDSGVKLDQEKAHPTRTLKKIRKFRRL